MANNPIEECPSCHSEDIAWKRFKQKYRCNWCGLLFDTPVKYTCLPFGQEI